MVIDRVFNFFLLCGVAIDCFRDSWRSTIAALGLFCISSAATGNAIPQVVLPAPAEIEPGQSLSLSLRSSDADGAPPAVFLLSGPEGMTIERITSSEHRLEWTATDDSIGRHTLQLLIEDAQDRGLTVSRRLSLTVRSSPSSESTVSLLPLRNRFLRPGQRVNFTVTAINRVGVETLIHVDWLPEGAHFRLSGDGSRRFFWQTAEADQGQYHFRFTAVDASNSDSRDTLDVIVTIGAPGQRVFPSTGPADNLLIEPLPARSIVANRPMTQLLRLLQAGKNYRLFAVNLPPGATFDSNGEQESVLRWQPEADQVGEFNIMFEARDIHSNAMASSTGFRLSVVADRTDGDNQSPILQHFGEQRVSVGEQLEFIARDRQVPTVDVTERVRIIVVSEE